MNLIAVLALVLATPAFATDSALRLEAQGDEGVLILTDGSRMREATFPGEYAVDELVTSHPAAREYAELHHTNARYARISLYAGTGALLAGIIAGSAANRQGLVIGGAAIFGLAAIPFFHFLGRSRENLDKAISEFNGGAPVAPATPSGGQSDRPRSPVAAPSLAISIPF